MKENQKKIKRKSKEKSKGSENIITSKPSAVRKKSYKPADLTQINVSS